MKEVILCYQGEMALKGLNKATFEAALAKALRFRVRELGKFQVYKAQSTMYVEPRDEEAAANFDEAFKRVSQVFGLAALSRAARSFRLPAWPGRPPGPGRTGPGRRCP